MEKIKLSNNARRILFIVKENNYEELYKEDDNEDLAFLHEEGLLQIECIGDEIVSVNPTNKFYAYFSFNPQLSNPSVFDDKKYLITTCIAVFALIISVISLIKSW